MPHQSKKRQRPRACRVFCLSFVYAGECICATRNSETEGGHMKMRTLLSFLMGAMGVSEATNVRTETLVYGARQGNGWTAKVGIRDENLDRVVMQLEKKIGPSDVAHGKLIPVAKEIVKRRGGKRWVSVPVSYENAEALYCALGLALKDLRQRRRKREHDEAIMQATNEVLSYFALQDDPGEK